MHLHQLLLILLSIFGTSILSGVFGMAGGMILMGLLVAVLNVGAAMALHGFAQLIANGTRAISLRRHIQIRSIGFFMIGFTAAGVAMYFVTFNPSRPVVMISLGLVSLLSLLPRSPQLDFKIPGHAVMCGFFVTIAHLTAGVSGPILDMFFVRSGMNRFEMIGTKALTQCLGHLLKIAYFGAWLASPSEIISEFPIWFLLSLVFLSITGTRLGGFILQKMSETNFRTALLRLFLVIGCTYVLMGVRELWF